MVPLIMDELLLGLVILVVADLALLLGGLLSRLHAYAAIALSALAFSLVHLQWQTLLLHAWLGLVLGCGYVRWGSLATVVVSHSLWNLYWSWGLIRLI